VICSKCKGLMVTARFSDFYQIRYEWRCLNCGAIVFPPTADRASALEVRHRLGTAFNRSWSASPVR
jgi:hypothetical protein